MDDERVSLGAVGNQSVYRASWMLLRYSVGRVDLEAGLREAILTLRGLEETLIVERTREFFEDEVLPTIRREAIEMVQRHRADGHHVVTLTSASNYMAELLGEHAIRWAHRHPVCGQQWYLQWGASRCDLLWYREKYGKPRPIAKPSGFSLENAYFYTDSYTDLPMLEA